MAFSFVSKSSKKRSSRSTRGLEGGLLRVNEVAELLSVHPNTVRTWANKGILPCYRLGTKKGDRRFTMEDIEAFVKRETPCAVPSRLVSSKGTVEQGFYRSR